MDSSGPRSVPAEPLGHSGFGDAQSPYSPLLAWTLGPWITQKGHAKFTGGSFWAEPREGARVCV